MNETTLCSEICLACGRHPTMCLCTPNEQSVGPFCFYVWNTSGGAPNRKHATYEVAEAEARRLARKSPGREFVVLQVRAVVSTEEPRVIVMRSGEHGFWRHESA